MHLTLFAVLRGVRGGQGFIQDAAEQGVDAFVTGEVSEQTIHIAREMGVHFCRQIGHHAQALWY